MADSKNAVFPPGVAKPAQRALAAIGVHSLEQLDGVSRARLAAMHGMGPKALAAIQAALLAQGKTLLQDAEGPHRPGT